MPTPPFIVDLRATIGHAPLWLMGANALVVRGDEVLLVRRSDTGEWAPISGIVDPGEHPSETAVREALEEAGVVIEVERLLWTVVMEEITYPNGDRCRFLDHGFRARWISGEPYVADEESTEVAWFPVDALPTPRQERLDAMLLVVEQDPRDVVFTL
ncbi:DNA mismatch repair protein MutT [Tessaracoccus aquimaris]|uniref:DNA mismatch repair protein MutT n=1 Tax=Tessaracoccus aquimaris TaxID=1332264 RepID=A0A1Q2CNR9_9ACTN|nr:NUDIX domain-containing protein [Tessaracoccus aquimaris]AQP47690.1 DNA mismatch repair protein MutT [Tessaracoccus aquimaris]